MRAYYPFQASRLLCTSASFFVALLVAIYPLRAQAPAAVPSAIIGKIALCPKTVWTIKDVPGCQTVDASQNDISLANNALAVVNTMVKSDEFKAAVLGANFDPAQMKTCPKNACGPQMTKQQIYDLIVASAPQKINVTYYRHHWPDAGNQGFEDSSALDTVFGNDGKINGDQGFLASLMLHEWMHILGFVHDPKNGSVCRSVPYEMNVIYDKLAPVLHLPPSSSGCTNQQ